MLVSLVIVGKFDGSLDKQPRFYFATNKCLLASNDVRIKCTRFFGFVHGWPRYFEPFTYKSQVFNEHLTAVTILCL